MAFSRAGEVFINGVVPVFGENSGNSLCNVSRRKRALRSLIRRKRLHIDKNYIPWLLWHMRDPSRRGRQDLPSSRRKPLGHAFLFAEQGNRVRIPDTEGISSLRLQPMNHRVQRGWQNSESSCISKVLFSVQRNLRAVKTGHWKGCHGSERRLKQCVCARKNPPHMNG